MSQTCPRGRVGRRDPRDRDLVRRDRRGGRHEGRRDPLERRRSQAELHAAYGGVVPEIASRRHLELVSPVIREALDEAGASLDDVDTRRRHRRARADRGAARRASRRRRALAWGRGLPLVPVNHLHGHVASLFLEPLDLEPPFTCLLASGGHTLLLDVQRPRLGRRAGARLDARRRGRRGVRQGRAPARARRTPAAPRSTGSRARATPRPTPSRSRACPGSTSRSRGSRPRSSTPCATSTPAELERAPRRPRRELPARDRARARRADRGGGRRHGRDRRRRRGELGAARVAARRRTRRRFALCTDNAAMIASAARYTEPVPAAEYLALDAFASAS